MFHVKHSAKHVGCMEFNLAQAKPLQPLELFSYKCLRSLNATFIPHSSGCCFNLLNMSWGLNTCMANPCMTCQW